MKTSDVNQMTVARKSVTTPDRGAYTVKEFCAWAGISRSKFYQEVNAGQIRLRKIGRKSVITVDEAENWLLNLPGAKL